MNKKDYKRLLLLSVYGELSEEEQAKLDKYLKTHPELKTELKELQKFKTFVSNNTPQEASDELLDDARQQLRSALRQKRQKQSGLVKVLEPIKSFFQRQWKLALGGVGTFGLGMAVGYYFFALAPMEKGIGIQPAGNNETSPRNTRIANVQFIDADASDGEIEFEFDAVAPMHIKGKIDDPEVQKILTHALLNENNVGVRLSTMNAIARQTEKSKSNDPAIKAALLKSLQSDENPGVRSEALRVLQRYPFDNDIRDALLHVLFHDANSGLRVAAVNALEMAKMDGNKLDEKSIGVVKQQMKKEQNNYVRNRAATLTKEIYQ